MGGLPKDVSSFEINLVTIQVRIIFGSVSSFSLRELKTYSSPVLSSSIMTFLKKLEFARRLCPNEHSLVARYVEALPADYRAIVREKTTLEAAMEEACFIEGDMAVKGQVTGVDNSKRKWDGPYGFSKKTNHSDIKC